MSDVIITVRGFDEARVAPEQAVAHVTATADGTVRPDVVERVGAIAEPVQSALTGLHKAGTVSQWTSARMSVWSERPWNADGNQLPPVHHASIDVTATFASVDALSEWLNALAGRDGIQVGTIEWGLTPATRVRIEREVATAAVAVAVERASAYAQAIGRPTITPIEIADLGLIGSSQQGAPMAEARMMKASASMDSAGGGANLRPDVIVVSAGVEARFSAR